MKPLVPLGIVFLVVALTGVVMLTQFRQKIDQALSQQPTLQSLSPSPTPLPTQVKTENTYLFVPYWTLPGNGSIDSEQETLVYFGVAANEQGIQTQEEGYKNLRQFVNGKGGKDSLLTIRMLESKANFSVLKNKKTQEKIIAQSIVLAKQNNF